MSKTVQFLDGKATGHLVEPTGGATAGVLVIQEWWGLVPHIEDVAARFAREGYAALAPDLYHGQRTVEAEEAQHLMEGLDWAQAVEEMSAAVQVLRERGCTRVGVVGFCMGGALAVLAGKNSGVDAAVAFYGFPDKEAVEGVCPPTQVFFGEHEEFFSVDDAREWCESQKKAGQDTALTVFPDAGHAFFNDTRPEVYHEASAKRAWALTLEHLGEHLKG